jgi:hypothetical protein
VAVTIRFDSALDFGQFGIGEQFGPTTQVESGLRLALRKFDGQCRHADKLPFVRWSRQGRAVSGMVN